MAVCARPSHAACGMTRLCHAGYGQSRRAHRSQQCTSVMPAQQAAQSSAQRFQRRRASDARFAPRLDSKFRRVLLLSSLLDALSWRRSGTCVR